MILLVLLAATPTLAGISGPVVFGTQKLDVREFDKPILQIAAGHDYTVALKSGGTVVAWGNNNYGQANVPDGLNGVTAIVSGFYQTWALKSDGTAVAWGYNDRGQTTLPASLRGVVAVSTGRHHTAVLKNDGTVVAWGTNDKGQTTVPAGLSGVTAVSAGENHTVALKSDGTVVAWGNNAAGQTTVPAGLSGAIAIAAGYNHTVALKSDGTVLAWGNNDKGQTTVPTGLAGVTAIAAGGQHTVALKNDGTVVAWGYNVLGQTTSPADLSNVIAIAAGANHTVALKQDGTVVPWGNNRYGQTELSSRVSGLSAVAVGMNHTVALKNDGTVVAWGDNFYGQTSVPAGLSGVIAIALGTNHSVALKSDGTVAVWGSSIYNQTTVPSGLSGVTAIAAGGAHTVALKSDGTVVAWGKNIAGETDVPAGLSEVTAIAAADDHTVALKSDGTVVAWGNNNSGETTVPDGLSGVSAIAAGAFHTVALKSDGTVIAWGSNTRRQASVPAGLSGVTAIAAGYQHTVVLKSDGKVMAWGDNDYGATIVPAGLTGVTAIAAARDITAVLVPLQPFATTGPASGISENGAMLSGMVIPNENDAAVSFEYGLTTEYGMSVAAIPASVAGSTTQLVSAALSGLQIHTTYHYRVVVNSELGTSYGEPRTFTTPNTTPVIGVDTVTASAGRTTTVDVLANDTDDDSDELTITAVTPGLHGTVAVRGGRIFYTPDLGFSGEDTFTYTISDSFGGTAMGTVTVTVPERPQDPVATLLSAKGQPVPGAGVEDSGTEDLPTDSVWATFGAPAINDAGQLAFTATVRVGKATHAGIFTYDAEEDRYTLVAKKGDTVPELQGPVFATLKDPVLDQSGRVAFLAKLSGPGTNKASNEGIFTTAYGNLQMLARKGDQPSDAPVGTKWTAFLSLALPDGVAGPLFVAKMAGAKSTGISAANDVGLWGADSHGNVRLLLREGQEINGKKLKSFVTLSTVLTVAGQTRSFNQAGEVIVRVHFTDGSQGLVTVQIP